MLKNLYQIGLTTLLVAAFGGLIYCLLLAGQSDVRGLANMGKCLLVALYGAYRLRSLLDRSYQIYRPWETARAKKTKHMLHGAMGLCLGLLACAVPATLAGVLPAPLALLVVLFLLLAVFLALETVNALNREPMAAYE